MAVGASELALLHPGSAWFPPVAIKTHAQALLDLFGLFCSRLLRSSYVYPGIFSIHTPHILHHSSTHSCSVRLPHPHFFFIRLFFLFLISLCRPFRGPVCYSFFFLTVVLISLLSSRCTYTTTSFRAGPGDVAVVRFRRWSLSPKHFDGAFRGGIIRPVYCYCWISIISYFTITNGRLCTPTARRLTRIKRRFNFNVCWDIHLP